MNIDIDKVLSDVNKNLFDDKGVSSSWKNIIEEKTKDYKSDATRRLEENKTRAELRQERLKIDSTKTKRELHRLESDIENQKRTDAKEREEISKLSDDKIFGKEIEKIKSLPIESFQTFNKGTKRKPQPIFMAKTKLLKIVPLSDEELKKLTFRGKRSIKKLFDQEIGQFLILLDFANSGWGTVNLTSRASRQYDHPCINNGRICFGNKEHTFQQLIKNYKLFDCLDIIIDLITYPLTGNPYIEWPNWLDDKEDSRQSDIKEILSEWLNGGITETHDSLFVPDPWYTTTAGSTTLGSISPPTEESESHDEILERARPLIESRMRDLFERLEREQAGANESGRPHRTNGAEAQNVVRDEAGEITATGNDWTIEYPEGVTHSDENANTASSS